MIRRASFLTRPRPSKTVRDRQIGTSFLTIFAALILLFNSLPARGDGLTVSQPYDPIIHVRLAHFFAGVSRVLITSDSALIAKDGQGNSLMYAVAGEQIDAAISQNGRLALTRSGSAADTEASQAGDDASDTTNPTMASFSAVSSTGMLQVALPGNSPKWHRYGGAVTLTTARGQLRITNDIPLEEYLCGVLKPEMGASAPLEALKAQAVAARTYAVRNIGHLAAEGADLDDTTRTQSYLGVDGETPSICDAVRSTAGLIMTYQGQPIEALYSTDCGGMTAQGGPGQPYLEPVSDPGCAAKPAWTRTYTKDELQAELQKSPLTEIGSLTSLSIESTDGSGRAARVLISGTDGEAKEVTGTQLREALGSDDLRSTLFTVKAGDGDFTFTGHGWGHGLGMCQQGAIALAQGAEPKAYDQILKHYYTGIAIVPLTPALVSAETVARSAPPRPHEISSSATSSEGKS